MVLARDIQVTPLRPLVDVAECRQCVDFFTVSIPEPDFDGHIAQVFVPVRSVIEEGDNKSKPFRRSRAVAPPTDGDVSCEPPVCEIVIPGRKTGAGYVRGCCRLQFKKDQIPPVVVHECEVGEAVHLVPRLKKVWLDIACCKPRHSALLLQLFGKKIDRWHADDECGPATKRASPFAEIGGAVRNNCTDSDANETARKAQHNYVTPKAIDPLHPVVPHLNDNLPPLQVAGKGVAA